MNATICTFGRSGTLLLYRMIRAIQKQNDCYHTWMQASGLKTLAERTCAEYLNHELLSETDQMILTPLGLRLKWNHPQCGTLKFDAEFLHRRSSLITTHVTPHDLANLSRHIKERRVAYVARDPRDVLVSLADFDATPTLQAANPEFVHKTAADFLADYDLCETQFMRWTQHVESALELKSCMALFTFRQLTREKADSIWRLSAYLELPCNIESVEADTSFAKMHAASPQHNKDGRTGKWTERLTSKHIDMYEAFCQPTWARYLETTNDAETHSLL